MKEISLIMQKRDKESNNILMEKDIKEILQIIWEMEKEFTYIRMGMYMKETGRMINNMDLVN